MLLRLDTCREWFHACYIACNYTRFQIVDNPLRNLCWGAKNILYWYNVRFEVIFHRLLTGERNEIDSYLVLS